jgi:hypothetical protein
MKTLVSMLQYLEKEGTKTCNQVHAYCRKWKQPMNISKTIAQLFHTQVKRSRVNVMTNSEKIELVTQFKYLGFTWTDRLSLKSTVEKCIKDIEIIGKIETVGIRTKFICHSASPIPSLILPGYSLFPPPHGNTATDIARKISSRSSAGVPLPLHLCTQPV